MMRRMAVVLLLLAGAGAAAPNPVKWEVRAAPAKPVRPGARFTIKLAAHVEEGWHLYAMKQQAGGPIPTRIWIAEGQPIRLTGPVKAAEGISFHDPTFNMEVEFYAGEALFQLPVRVVRDAAEGNRAIVSTSYQVCSDRICLAPRTVAVEVPVQVKK